MRRELPSSRGLRRRRAPQAARRAPARHAGFTLVEAMVALGLGLVVVGALVAAYLAAAQGGRHNDAMVQITEDATLALSVMRQQVAQAGFGVAHGTAATGPVLHEFPPVLGCEAANFGDLQAGILSPAACAGDGGSGAAAPDSLEVAYEASVLPGAASNGILGGAAGDQPLDCLGNAFAPTHDGAKGDYYLNDSKFYVAAGNLYCHGPGNAAGAAVVQNVETLQVRYGMALVGAGQPGAGQIAYYDVAPPLGSPLWADVVAVSLCVQVRSAAKVLDTAARATLGGYIDCDNVQRASGDGYLRRSFSTTVVLQNRLP